jgi:hypothetical protein
MVQPTQKDASALEEQAMLIAGEIFNLINQYTHDSNTSKFFLTDDIARVSYGLAGGFASVIYTKPLEPEELKDSAILSFIYALMTYGFNIYLRERSLTTNSSPYSLPTDIHVIKKVQKRTLNLTAEGKLNSTVLADKIGAILISNVKNQIDLQEFKMKDHRFNKKKFLDYTKLSLYWGYNFARELLNEKGKKQKPLPSQMLQASKS